MDLNKKLALLKTLNSTLINSLDSCSLCPRRCKVNRTRGKVGYCRAGLLPKIYTYQKHFGEEPPISGTRGSGTIFFSHCSMKCVYCQNYSFSQLDQGKEVSIDCLANIMFELQKDGCHNINLVSPTHFIPQILLALETAIVNGLNIPIVYNTSGYELAETIKLLNGIVDIYLPDMRYSRESEAMKYSDAPNYPLHNREAILEMFRQSGNLKMDESGIASSGIIIRLLSLPNNISGTAESLKFIKNSVSQQTYLSIMSQYYPTYRAYEFERISDTVSRDEYNNLIDEAHKLELNNGWIQEFKDKNEQTFLGTNIKPK